MVINNTTKVSVFDTVLNEFPTKIRKEIIKTDGYLKSLRPLRFKRVVDKKAKKITYVASDYGVSYMFRMSDDGQAMGHDFSHNFQWYLVYNGKPETWHRRGDFMEETLIEIAKHDYPLALRVFNSLRGCPGLDNCHGERCLARTPYTFEDKKRLTCHGSVVLGHNKNDFQDARDFFRFFNELVIDKVNNGEPLPEKIIVSKMKRS